jgi:DNA-directed RNA polymerase subunit L
MMIGHRIRIPDDVDPMTALKRAIKKVSTSDFKEKRQAVY